QIDRYWKRLGLERHELFGRLQVPAVAKAIGLKRGMAVVVYIGDVEIKACRPVGFGELNTGPEVPSFVDDKRPPQPFQIPAAVNRWCEILQIRPLKILVGEGSGPAGKLAGDRWLPDSGPNSRCPPAKLKHLAVGRRK